MMMKITEYSCQLIIILHDMSRPEMESDAQCGDVSWRCGIHNFEQPLEYKLLKVFLKTSSLWYH